MITKLKKIFLAIIILVIVCFITFIILNINNKTDNPLDIMAEESSKEKLENNEELKVQECIIDGKSYEVVAVLYIPTLDIEYPVLSSTSKELLKVALNKYWGPNPNRPGNFCILGHNFNDEKFFGKLHKIQKGEVVQLTDMYGVTLQYYVYDTYIVDPDNTDCTSQLTNGDTEITLITCTKDFRKRFVVKAKVE